MRYLGLIAGLILLGGCSRSSEPPVGRYQLLQGKYSVTNSNTKSSVESSGVFKVDTVTGQVWKYTETLREGKVLSTWLPQGESAGEDWRELNVVLKKAQELEKEARRRGMKNPYAGMSFSQLLALIAQEHEAFLKKQYVGESVVNQGNVAAHVARTVVEKEDARRIALYKFLINSPESLAIQEKIVRGKISKADARLALQNLLPKEIGPLPPGIEDSDWDMGLAELENPPHQPDPAEVERARKIMEGTHFNLEADVAGASVYSHMTHTERADLKEWERVSFMKPTEKSTNPLCTAKEMQADFEDWRKHKTEPDYKTSRKCSLEPGMRVDFEKWKWAANGG